MTVAQIQDRILSRLAEVDENRNVDARFYSPSEVLAKINEGQQLFALLTLCLEKTSSYTLAANTTFSHLLSSLTDFVLPLKVRINSSGARLTPNTLTELDAVDTSWQKSSGTPERYNLTGLDLFAVYKQPTSGTALDITHAYAPARMDSTDDTPEIPAEYHMALADYGFHALRVKEGGEEFIRSLDYLDRFLDDADQCSRFVRERMVAQGYDHLPFEVRAFDRSRLHRLRRRLPRMTPALAANSSSSGGGNG